VLARDDVYRQWAYTALSRGTDRNQLYVVAEAHDDRAEYAPTRPRDVGERVQTNLGRSRAQALASDEARSLVDAARRLDKCDKARERWRATERDRDSGRGL
jgi:hypothetical protein